MTPVAMSSDATIELDVTFQNFSFIIIFKISVINILNCFLTLKSLQTRMKTKHQNLTTATTTIIINMYGAIMRLAFLRVILTL